MEKKKYTLGYFLKNLDAVITCVTLFCCVILVNLNVIMRYIFNNPIQWVDEVVTSLFVWTVFIGSAYAYRKHAHLGVDLVVNLFHGKTREIIQWVVAILELLILIMLTGVSGQYVYNLIFRKGVIKLTLTETLRLPKWWTGIAVPLGFGLSAIYSIYFFLTDRFHIIKKKEPKTDEHQVTGGNF